MLGLRTRLQATSKMARGLASAQRNTRRWIEEGRMHVPHEDDIGCIEAKSI